MIMLRSTHDVEVAVYRKRVDELLRFVSAARLLAERHESLTDRVIQLEKLLGMTSGQKMPQGESEEMLSKYRELQEIKQMIMLVQDKPALRMVDRSKKRNELVELDDRRRQIENDMQKLNCETETA